ncbi:hypothetical protein [Ammoniphilus resinae]|uniref:Uncharacterized protein n=1 Tax=Ammoniphilus resinae TaxID=861532 RepID=A0ABS4GJ50_9BACL|nr:hypothetical protein [Ammoniphilus resinae]MBP1930284.1 hypothetical protein [Ammoniphilus resinae]
MKTDPLCLKCIKTCKQVRPAIVEYCAKYLPKEKANNAKVS